MKTINYKLICVFLLTTLAGCMPDSLTKFQKSTPKPQTKSTGVVVTDPSGNVISGSSITYPTTFSYFKSADGSALTEWDIQVGVSNASTLFTYNVDKSLGDAKLFPQLFIRCELDKTGSALSQTLPSGIVLDASTCLFSGTSTAIYSDVAPNLGKPLSYYVRMYFKNGKNYAVGYDDGTIKCESSTECYIKSPAIKIGSYKVPSGFKITQNDKLGLELTGIETGISVFKPDDANFTTRTDIVSTSLNSIGSIQIVDDIKSILYIQRAIPLTVANTTGFTAGSTVSTFDTIVVSSAAGLSPLDTVTSGSYTGTINYISGTTIRVLRSATSGSSLTVGATLTNGTVSPTVSSATLKTPLKGVILSIDATNNVLRVTQDPNYGNDFSVNDVVTLVSTTTALPGNSLNSTVSSIDLTEGIRNQQKIDNDTQFYSSEATVKNYISYYPVSTTTNISPISPIIGTNDTLAANNGITYTISPALPAGLSFDTSTGIISGHFNTEQTATVYTIQASNPLGSDSYTIKLASIYAPKDLNYSGAQLITVSNSVTNPQTLIYEGERFYKSLTTGETENVTGLIRRKFANPDVSRTETSLLEVESNNGILAPGASLDSGSRTFVAEKAYISATDPVYNYNLVLYVNTVAPFATTGTTSYISNSGNAVGRIVYINTTTKALYVQLLTPSATTTSTVNVFSQPDTICNRATYDAVACVGANIATVSALESSNYKLTLADGSSFSTGLDVTANATTNYIGGYIYSKPSTNVVTVNTVTRTPSPVNGSNYVTTQTPEFLSTQNVVPEETYPGSSTPTTISKVEYDNVFFANRTEFYIMSPNMSQGTNVIYTVTPALPTGLTLNPLTGVIYGTPSVLTPAKAYVVTAKNLLGSSTFKFTLEVRDFFTLKEMSDATSYQLHKVGDSQNNRKCRINAADIKAGTGNLDINCYLDGQEEDFHFEALKFKTIVGAGVCEYIQYVPFSYWQYKPTQATNNKVHVLAGNCPPASVPSFAPGATDDGIGIFNGMAAITKYTTQTPAATNQNYCPGNYTGIDSTYPNCDEGKFTIVTHTGSYDAGTSTCTETVTTTTTNCGGTKVACISGAIRDIITDDASLKKGKRSIIYSASDSSANLITHKAPITYGDLTNLRFANGSLNNQCSDNPNDSDVLYNKAMFYTSSTDSPFGSTTSPIYMFNCLDAAYDIKAKIRLIVRDWDSAFKVTSQIDKHNPTSGIMNRNYTNYYADWDDFYGVTAAKSRVIQGGCGDTHSGVCSDTTYTNKYECEQVGSATWTFNGSCSNAAHTTPATCDSSAGETWTYGYCKLTGAAITTCGDTNAATCAACAGTYNPGYCTNSTYTTKATCTAAKFDWKVGICMDTTNTTPGTCGGTWQVDYNYEYPGQYQ